MKFYDFGLAGESRRIDRTMLNLNNGVSFFNPALKRKIIMRINIVLILMATALLQVSASTYAQKITLAKSNASIVDIFKAIQAQSDYDFIYSNRLITKAGKIDIHVAEASLLDVLEICFKNQPFTYSVNNRTIVVKEKEHSLRKQEIAEVNLLIDITGRVIDENGLSVPGVSVKYKGSSTGAVSDADGYYRINTPGGTGTLVFSSIGYVTQEVAMNSRNVINVTLEANVAGLKEVLVVGYGTQSRETVTTSISKLDPKVLANVPLTNAALALQGTISGMRVQSNSGQPGSAPVIIIRGGTSINNPNGSAPLFIIDGVIKPDMNNISTDEIESIQVLKDAAATSIYGARGSNGVVMIITKSGKAGKNQVTFSSDVTVSNLDMYFDFLTARDWIYYMRTGLAASGKKNPGSLAYLTTDFTGAGTGGDLTKNTAYTTQYLTPQNQHKLNEGWQSMPDPLDPSKTIIFDETDQTNVLFREAISTNHSLSLSGGSENATFSAVMGYQDAQGIVIDTDNKRYSLNLSGDLKVNNKLKFFGRLMYANTSDSQTPLGASVAFQRITAPTAKLYYEDGTLARGFSLFLGNPLYQNSVHDVKNSLDNTTMILGGQYDILPGLKFEPQISLYLQQFNNRFFRKSHYSGQAFDNERRAMSNFYKMTQPQADAVLSYNKDVNLHHFDAKVGLSYFQTSTISINATGRNAATDLIPTLNASALPVLVTGSDSEQIIMGTFGRINYDFNQKYLLSMNLRYDGASNLGENHKWGVFPGISVGWNVNKEQFWGKLLPENLLMLKLRGSYGVNGNISGLGRYAAQGAYRVGTPYGGVATIQNSELSNQELKWERSKTLNFGMDIGIFDQRVNILVDIYRRVTDDLLASMALPPSSGFGSVVTNLSSLENKGFDLELNVRLLPNTSPFQWDISFNTAHVKNKILKLPDNGVENNRIGGELLWDSQKRDYTWQGGLQEGGRIGDLFAYKQISIYRTDEEAAAGPVDMIVSGTNKTKYGGDVNWQDTDGNGVIDTRDRVYVGNQYPTFYGGFTNMFSYKNISLYARMDYMTGHTLENTNRLYFVGNAIGVSPMLTDLLRSWQKPGDVTDMPRFYWADQGQSNLFRGNSKFFEDSDFLALRELTLSYNLPARFFKNKINGLKIHASGYNLNYFTRFERGTNGGNPEAGGNDTGRYPLPRTFVFGLKASL